MEIAADTMTDPAMVADRLKMWSDVYMAVMEDAPCMPVFNEQRDTMKSERMGGADALCVDPVSGPSNTAMCLSPMCNKLPDHTIHGASHHCGSDNSFVPAETVAPGSTIEFNCFDSSAGQLTPDRTVEHVHTLDFGRINSVSGPIYVDGAEPGDALKIQIEALNPPPLDGRRIFRDLACSPTSSGIRR